MPIIYRDSETWPDTAGKDENTVLGDESLVIGDETDPAAALIKLLFGPPIQQIRYNINLIGVVTRRISLAAVVRY